MSNKDEQLQMPENPENQTVQSADAPEAAEQEKISTAQQADAQPVPETQDSTAAESAAPEKEKFKKEKKSRAKQTKDGKLKNKNAVKRSTFMLIFILVLIGALVLVNVLSSVIAQRLPTTVDVTADASNSLTEENIEFIRGIEDPVEIIVCATREGYTGSEMINYAYNTYYVQENSTPYNYFNQTVTLIENYPKYNSKIKVSYIDIQSPKFDELESGSDVSLSYGNILVRCTREVDGKQTTNTSVITFEDIYDLYDSSGGYASYGMGYYTITSSNIESELSGAIYTVASSEKKKIALLTGHSADGADDALVKSLESYNFEFTEIDGKVNAATLEDVDIVLMVSPVSDLAADELKLLDTFLDNDGKRGKSFLVFGSTSAPATPNLDQFMEEWGIVVEDGMAYETSSKYRNQDTIMLFNKEDDLTKNVNSSELLYLAAGNVALSRGYETKDSRTTHVLMTTSPYAVIAPKGTAEGYTPPSSQKASEMPVVIVTEDTSYDENYTDVTSYVGYFASADFVSSAWSQYSDVGNSEYALTVVNAVSGRDNMYFLPKITGTVAMTVSDAQKTAVKIVTLYVLPLVVLIGGVFVWIWRKNR